MMRRALLAPVVLALSLSACSSEEDASSQLQAQISAAVLPGSSSGAPALSESDARFVLNAERVFAEREDRREPADVDALAELANVARAAFPNLSERLARDAPGSSVESTSAITAAVRDIAQRYALATAEEATGRQVAAEAQLGAILDHLKKASPNARLPEDPLFLLPKETLEQMRAALAPVTRRLQTAAATIDTPDTRAALRQLSARVSRIDGIIASADHGRIQDAVINAAKQIPSSRWQAPDAVAGRERWAQAQQERLWAALEAAEPSWRFERMVVDPTRGPPGTSLTALLLDDVRSYEIDPVAWARSNARLRAIESTIPDAARRNTGPDGWRRTLVSAVPDASLDRIGTVVRAYRTPESGLPTISTGSAGRARDLSLWDSAIRDEQSLRRTVRSRPEAASVGQAVKHYTLAQGDSLERASEPWYVATIQQRYGRLSDAPLAAREEVIRIVGRRAAEYTEQFFKEARRLNALDDIVVRAKQVPAGAISSKAAAVRELLAGADVLSQHIDVLLASGRVDDAEQARKQLELVRRWLGARPPPPATPSPSRYVPTVVPAFEGNLARARASLASAEQILRTVPADAPSFSGAVGRSVIDGSALKASSVNWHATIDRTQKRNDWAGLLDDQKRPFEFKTHVDNFRTFRGVGGGIHFGNDASPSSEQTFAQSVLSYDVNRGALELSMPDGAVYVYVAPPDVTRSLYQFAAARRNAAISIGWSGTSHVRDRDQRSQSILLDPYFVDTRVGRDLILADTIPWTLDQATLPNGTINPIAGTFKRELAAYHAAQLAQTNTLLANIEPFRESDRSTWASQMSSTFLGIIVKTLLESDSKTAALATLTELSTRLNDEQQKTFSGLLTELTPSLSENTSKASREVASLAVVLSSRSGSTQDVALFRLWSAFELADETKGNRVTLDLARRRVAERAVAAVPVTSLAVLMDQPTQIVLQRGNRGVHGLGLVGSMKYRYATSRLEDGDAGVLRSARDAQGNVEAVEIQGLTAAANSGLAALEEAYRPLRAVAEYARIKAFLAWATANVGRVDLSALASVQPQSPAFRTPDALRR